MARPIRCRRICFEPEYNSFAPYGMESTEQILLMVDEFEAVSLIDYEKRTHEQCAKQMGVSRTTVTEMYERARTKIADCIVNGKTLSISGGNYALCDGSAWMSCGRKCNREEYADDIQSVDRKELGMMKIAVTYENGNIFQHFGHTQQFKVYNTLDGTVVDAQIISTNGNGHGALANLLTSLGVNVLICGGIGGGAQAAIAQAGIKLYGGANGSADEAVKALVTGTLKYNPDVKCNHHNHEHGESGHTCGEHGCGNHNCH